MQTAQVFTRRMFSIGGLAGLAALLLPRITLGQGAATPPSPGKFVSSSEEKANIKVVQDFLAAWDRKDIDKAASLVADDISFRFSQGRPPIVGKEKMMETLKGAFERSSYQLKILKTTTLGPIVLNQREDIITPASGGAARKINIAAGMFFVDNGKIVEWTDYQLK